MLVLYFYSLATESNLFEKSGVVLKRTVFFLLFFFFLVFFLSLFWDQTLHWPGWSSYSGEAGSITSSSITSSTICTSTRLPLSALSISISGRRGGTLPCPLLPTTIPPVSGLKPRTPMDPLALPRPTAIPPPTSSSAPHSNHYNGRTSSPIQTSDRSSACPGTGDPGTGATRLSQWVLVLPRIPESAQRTASVVSGPHICPEAAAAGPGLVALDAANSQVLEGLLA